MNNKYDIVWTTQFKKDHKLAMKRHLDIAQLDELIKMIASGDSLDAKYSDHPLSGNWKGYRECHIQPDWLLVYKLHNNTLILTLTRTGTHSDIFGE